MRPDLLRVHHAELARREANLFWFRSRRRLIVNALRRYFPDAMRICEIGCGTGFVLDGLRQALPDATFVGADAHLEPLTQAKRRMPSIPLVQLDIGHLPFADAFDVVCLFDVLEHIDDDGHALRTIREAMAPQGGVMITVPQHRWLWSPVDDYSLHRRRYTRHELQDRLVEAGFRPLLITSFNSLLLPVLLINRLKKRLQRGPFDPLAEYKAPALVNAALFRVMELERSLIERGVRFAAGGSLLAVARC